MLRGVDNIVQCHVIILVMLCHYFLRIEGSVSILSTADKVSVLAGSPISLYCHIEPFDHNKCHGWYRENKRGEIEVIVEGSEFIAAHKEINPGDIVLPNKDKEHNIKTNFSTACSFHPDNKNSHKLSIVNSTTERKYPQSYSQTFTHDLYSISNYNHTTTSDTLSTAASVNSDMSEGEDMLQNKNRKVYAFRHENNYILTILEMENSDEGRYFCKYHCEDCDSQRVELIFTYPATTDSVRLISEPNELFVDFHEIVTLTCEVKSRPVAKVQWILVLNGVNVPHVEELDPYSITYDNLTDHFTVVSVFKFRGGSVFSNPMVIYCQVVSPVSADSLIDKSMHDMLEADDDSVNSHAHRRRRSYARQRRAMEHGDRNNDEHQNFDDQDEDDLVLLYSSVDGTEPMEQHKFLYEFETDMEHGHDEKKIPIHYEYLTTLVYKRWVYDLPTTAFSRRWRLAMIVLMTAVLVLPILVGIIQIFIRKTSGLNIGAREQGVEEYYRLAKNVRDEQNELIPGESETKTESDSKA